MAREHGILIFLDQFICTKEKCIPKTDGSNGYITECEQWTQCYTKDDWEILECGQDNFHIHPDCHKNIEPLEGDIIQFNWLSKRKQVVMIFEDNNDASIYERALSLEFMEERNDDKFQIIQRNGKAFFMPEAED